MPCFPMFCSPFCSMLMLGLYAHMLYITFMITSCLDLHVVCMFYAPMLISESSHACMLGFMSFHIYVLNFYMLHVSMPRCLSLCFHMLVC